MPRSQYSANSEYRYGFNGQERSTEIHENSFTAEFWEYDARLGRRWNIDPVVKINESPYFCFSGNPIVYVDPLGNDPIDRIKEHASKKGIKNYKVKENIQTGSMIMSWFSEDSDGGLTVNSKVFKPTNEELDRHVGIEKIFGNSSPFSFRPIGLNKYAYYNFKDNKAQGVKINSFKQALYHSLKRIADEVYIGPELLDKVIEDGEFKKFQKRYNSFGNSKYVDLVCFGGEPLDENKIKDGSKAERFYEAFKAISASTNELTWVVRNTMVTAEPYRNAENIMGTRYRFNDEFNVVRQPGDKGEIYNNLATYFEKYYHGSLGGSKIMKIKMDIFIPNK